MTVHRFETMRRVLAAVDLGCGALPALDYAAGIARCRGAHLIVMHATGFAGSPLDLHADEPDPVARETAARAFFDAWREGNGDTSAEFVSVRSRAPDGIVETAIERDVGLVVVAPLIRAGLEAAAHHSVTAALIRSCPCPVLAVPVTI